MPPLLVPSLEPPLDELPAIATDPATPAAAALLGAPLPPGAPPKSVGVEVGDDALLHATAVQDAESRTLTSSRYFIPGSCPDSAEFEA